MAEGSRRSSKQSSIRSNPPPPPPRQRTPKSGKDGTSGGGGRSTTAAKSTSGKSVTSARSSRTRETTTQTNNNRNSRSKSQSRVESSSRSRSKSRPRESQQQKEINRSRSKSRPKESPAREDKRRSRSKSTPRQQSQKKHTQVRSDVPNNKQQSNKKSPSKQNQSNNNAGGGSSTRRIKKQPSAKKREKFAANAKKAIPATVHMISGSHDIQTSSDVSNITSQFQLPNPAGRSGGACTAALLQVLYESHEHGDDDMSWVDVLRRMRIVLDEKGFDQIPQLTSSRNFDVHTPFVITPTDGSFNHKNNTQRAILIGINYTGQSGQLTGCHNDVHNINKYLTEVQGFRKENVTILMDDGRHKPPTKAAIMNAFKRVVKESKDGDVVFCHYSGHGGRLRDDNGDEEDGFDETLIPLDFNKAGQIRDDALLKTLIHPMPAGVTLTCLMDCCHSGTVLDLPYRFTADGDMQEMEMNDRVSFKDALWSGMGLALGASAVASAAEPVQEMMILGGGPNAIHEYSDTDCCVLS